MDKKDQAKSNLSEHIIQTVKTKHPKTITQLVDIVYEKHPLAKQDIMARILDLEKHGKLNFKEVTTYTPSTLRSYLSSSNSYWYWLTLIHRMEHTGIECFHFQQIFSRISSRVECFAFETVLVVLDGQAREVQDAPLVSEFVNLH